MTPHIEHLIQQIGSEILEVCQCEPSAAVLYAEFADGVVSGSVFFTNHNPQSLIYKFAGATLSSLAYELWEQMASLPNGEPWRAMAYSIKDGKLAIKGIYENQFNEKLEKNKRRLLAATEVLGEFPVDYANP